MVDDPEISPKYRAVKEIDRLLDPKTRIRDKFGKLCRAMLEHQGVPVDQLSNADTISTTLELRQTGGNKRFFAAVFLRLLGATPNDVHDLDTTSGVGVAKLLESLPQVSKALDIDRKAQGFERSRAFEAAAPRAESYLLEALEPPRHLRLFDQVHQRVMRVHKNPLVSAVIAPFLPDFLAKKNLKVILESLHEYVESELRERINKYREVRARVEAVLVDCRRYDTRFVTDFFLPFFSAVLEALDAEFESSPIHTPGALSVRTLGKKYPFSVQDAEVRLSFAVDNLGAGLAFDVQFSIEADQCLLVASPSRFLDELGPSTSLEPVEFYGTVACPSEDSVLIAAHLMWTNGDGTASEWDDILEIPTQRSDIPWADLQTLEPYSLEPVRKADELIGRSDQILQLVAKLRSPSVGSFWVHGQRRVGKTSVVATLDDLPETDELTILYLDTGMFIGRDPEETVNNLGDKICTRLLESSVRLTGLTAPSFGGALFPLDDFLSEALARDPELRLVIVLDEFDELPPELYRRGGGH